MGAASLQEKVLKVADEVEKLKEELSDVKYRLQKKKEELKALKKLASEPQSQVYVSSYCNRMWSGHSNSVEFFFTLLFS